MPELQARKRDGSTEPFMREKIYDSIVKSGATPEQAESITSQIESWAPSMAEDGAVSTSLIRDKVIELLGAENPAAAENFESFRKQEAVEAEVPAAPEE